MLPSRRDTPLLPLASRGDEATPTPPSCPNAASVQWLAFLFVQTLFIFVLQICAGVFGESVAILADIGHSGADVVSYGLNYVVERRKDQGVGSLSPKAHAAARVKSDLIGCLISTVLLLAATVLATREAVSRLLHPGEFSDSDDKVGAAMLSFALVSTAANVFTLFLYRRWHPAPAQSARSLPLQSPSEADRTMAAADVSPSTLLGEVSPTTPYGELSPNSPLPPLPKVPMAPPPPPPHAQHGRRSKKGRPFLDLRADFEGCAQDCCKDPILNSSSTAAVPVPDCSGCGSGCSGDGRRTSAAAMLHMLVHPGCTGHHGPELEEKEGEGASLNVTAAMLHLVADLLRGLAILGGALAIELGWVSNPEKADAVCALFVAGFVGLGSVELLRRSWTALQRCRSFSTSETELMAVEP